MPCCKHVAAAEARTIMVKTTPPVRWKGLRVSDERAKPCMRRAKKRAAAEGINQPRRGPAFLREDDQQEHEGNIFGEVAVGADATLKQLVATVADVDLAGPPGPHDVDREDKEQERQRTGKDRGDGHR